MLKDYVCFPTARPLQNIAIRGPQECSLLPFPCKKHRPKFIIGLTVKIPKEAMKYFRQTGAEGGRARARNHSPNELSAWGKLGGRPKGSGKKQKKGGK